MQAERSTQRRSYGTGQLFTKGGKWYGRWYVGDQRVKRAIGPLRKPGTRDGMTRPQAERQLRRLIETETPSIMAANRTTVGEAGRRYVDHLESVMERKRTTIQDYRGYLRRHIEPFFGDRALDRIDGDLVAAYMKRKREKLASKTVQNHLNFLHGVFSFGVKRGWARENPVALVDRPRKARSPHRRIRFLRPAELNAVIGKVPDDQLGEVERPLYLAAGMTGLRQGELLGLRWIDVDWIAGQIRVADNYTRGEFDTPKSDHGRRSVPMAARLARELELHFQRSAYQADDDLVFCHPLTGHVLDPSKLRKRFKTP